MAAINKECFDKKCQCATCTNMCSRCLVGNTDCKNGKHDCTRYQKMEYDTYKETYNYVSNMVSESLYNA